MTGTWRRLGLAILLIGGLAVAIRYTQRPAKAPVPPPHAGGALVGTLRGEPATFNRFVNQGLPAHLVSLLTQARLVRINRLTDVALKATSVRPGMQIIERYFGMLEVHSPEQAETRAAGAAILESIGLTEADRIKPRILSSQIVRRIDDHHAQLINRTRHGQMIMGGQTLYVLECEPAAYAALAANEAEKAAEINVLEVRSFGSMGRVYLGGEERDIDVGWQAAVAAIESIEGRSAGG